VTTTLPFTDVMASPFFCQIAEAFFSGLTNGTSSTTYNPGGNVTREQMAAFMTRAQDSALSRGSKRAALGQFWTTTPNYPSASGGLGLTSVGTFPEAVQSDGEDLWVANSDTVSRVRGSDGKLLDTWTGATSAFGVLVAMGRVFVTGRTNPGSLYLIDPTGPAGPVTEVTGPGLGANPVGIAFDGSRIWTANPGTGPGMGSVSFITPSMFTTWGVNNVTTGFSQPLGALFDGSNIWVTDSIAGTLLKVDSMGAIVQTVNVGAHPEYPCFDGMNIWVPNAGGNSITVVRAATGSVLATLTGNGLNDPIQTAFDGQRILVTNFHGNSVSLWRAADLTPMGAFSTGASTLPGLACSDGTYFWITLFGANQLGRF
jgi:hypothetical protein